METQRLSPDWLELPDKGVDCLLDYLNLWNLMNMRLVCKKTKSWVENSEVLRRFCVHIPERKFMKKILKSKVIWSNLAITCDAEDISGEWINTELYLSTFSKLNQSLKVLKLSQHRLSFQKGLILIIRNCPNIQSLEVETLDVSNAILPLSEELIDATKCLEKLAVSYLAWETENDLQLIPEILGNCKNLKYFKIPYILSMVIYSLYPNLDEEGIHQQGLGEYSLKYLDVENYDLDELLPSLLPACKQAGCLLLNLHESLERAPTVPESDLLGDTTFSMLKCTNHLPLNRLDKLRSINIDENSDVDKACDAPLPSLNEVHLTLTNSILKSDRMASCFLQRKRESVAVVSIKFKDLEGSAQNSVFRPVKFAPSLPQLRRLQLDGFDGKVEDYRLFWKSFPLLEDLQLQNCRTLCDKAFSGTGENEHSFLSLKYMKKLVLEYAEVTDATLENVLSDVSLEVLVLSLPKVTFEGLKALSNVPLTQSLMVFNCMSPDNLKEQEFKEYFTHSKNLKKFEIMF